MAFTHLLLVVRKILIDELMVFDDIDFFFFLSIVLNSRTVEPVYNGHPRDLRNWPLNTGVRLIEDH